MNKQFFLRKSMSYLTRNRSKRTFNFSQLKVANFSPILTNICLSVCLSLSHTHKHTYQQNSIKSVYLLKNMQMYHENNTHDMVEKSGGSGSVEMKVRQLVGSQYVKKPIYVNVNEIKKTSKQFYQINLQENSRILVKMAIKMWFPNSLEINGIFVRQHPIVFLAYATC